MTGILYVAFSRFINELYFALSRPLTQKDLDQIPHQLHATGRVAEKERLAKLARATKPSLEFAEYFQENADAYVEFMQSVLPQEFLHEGAPEQMENRSHQAPDDDLMVEGY